MRGRAVLSIVAAVVSVFCMASGAAWVAAEGTLPGQDAPQLVDESAAQPTNYVVSLQYGDIDTRAGEPSVPESLRVDSYPSDGVGYYMVQYAGAILAEWRTATEATGARIVGYVPYNTYVLVATGAQLDAVRGLPEVQWIGIYQPAYRVAPALLAAEAPVDQVLNVLTFDKADGAAVREVVEANGGEVLSEELTATRALLKVRLPAAAVSVVAGVNGVAWIEPWNPPELANSEARSIMDVEDKVWAVNGLRGEGQIIAIADTGLDVGDPVALNNDFRDRVVGTPFAYGRTGDWSDPNGHGTHVAGSALGSGHNSGADPATHNYAGSQAGVAPEARLVFQSTEDAAGGLGGLFNLTRVFTDAYQAGARVHSNSWGAVAAGGYDTQASIVDEFVWNHPDLTVVFSAANSGTDADGNGVVDLGSVRTPGRAKNVITVGATESVRANGGLNSGGFCATWAGCWPSNFPAAPISTDPISNSRDGMAAFSARGPADRSRIKPDVVAPGTNILSVRSRQYSHVMDAESGPGGWSGAGWSITSTVGYNSAHAWATGAYPDNANLVLTSPDIDTRTGANAVTYWTHFDLGSGDTGRVEYLDGATWRTCDSITGSASTWVFRQCLMSVDDVNLEHVRVRFRLVSNGSGSGTGWFLDQIRFTPRAWGFLTENGLPSDDYIYMGGTSMAAPLVSGAAALTREAYARRGHQASAALVRATLVNGAVDISPGQYATGATQEIPNRMPNNVMGWGRVNVQASLVPDPPTVILFKDISQARGLQTNGTHVYRYEVRNRSVPFRVTLVWLDRWGLPTSGATSLSNDLDLEVTQPDNTRLWPNGGSSADTVNNTEDVFVAANTAQSGVYVLTVRGRSIAFGPQGYALVVRGGELRELPRIAVNPAQYDDIGAVLTTMGYPWQQISDGDFAQYSKIQPYEVLFANCSGNAHGNGASAAGSLKQFVGNGGSLYASDWAYTYVKSAFPGYVSFDDEPRIGSSQTVVARITDPGLANYLDPANPPSTITLKYDLSNWAVINDVAQGTKVYLRGTVATSKGTQTDKPLLVSFVPSGTNAGRVTYTTFHNEKQQSALEKKLLEYLVLVPSTSQLAAQAEQVVKDAGLKVKQTNLNTINPGQTTPRVSYKLTAVSPLMFVLNWGGSTLRLTVYRPDGSVFQQVESSNPPLAISIPNAAPGTWQYQVAAVSVPTSNYPYVMVIGDQAPLGDERVYLPMTVRLTGQLDQGWQRAEGAAGRVVLKLAAVAGDCNTLVAGTDAGLLRSFDGGRSWSFGNQPVVRGDVVASGPAPLYDGILQASAGMITAVATCPGQAGVIYAGTWGAGVYRSTDYGASWSRSSEGIADGWIYDLAVNRVACQVVYAATSSGGVFKTTNGGGQWQAQNAGLGELKAHVLAIASSNPNRVYVGTTAGVFASENEAGNWRSTGSLPAGIVHALVVSPVDASRVYAGGDFAGLMRSTDAGWNWQATSLLGPRVRSLAATESVIYTGFDAGGVYRSMDAGDTWQAYDEGLEPLSVKAVLWSGGSCNALLAGTSNGVWRRSDAGN